MRNFNCKFIYSNIDNDIIMVGFADQEYDTKKYILLQKKLQPSKKDIEAKMNGIHFEYCDQIHSGYDCIDEIHVSLNAIVFYLSTEFANSFQMSPKLLIDISEAKLNKKRFVELLSEMCKNSTHIKIDTDFY